MNPALLYLALGANLGDAAETFRRAIERINAEIGKVSRVSSFYRTAPLNPPELEKCSQPDFLNAALECESALAPGELIKAVLQIEHDLGRDRSTSLRWGPRLIDIDVLLYGSLVIESKELRIPHPEMHKRGFVLKPLSEIAPEARHPVLNASVAELLRRLASTGPV